MNTKKKRAYLSINLSFDERKVLSKKLLRICVFLKNMTDIKAHIMIQRIITSMSNDFLRYERRKTIQMDITCPMRREKKALSPGKKSNFKR
jgi:hypothetical protein